MNIGILEEVLNLQSIIIRNWCLFVKSQGCVRVWVHYHQHLCCNVYTPLYNMYIYIYIIFVIYIHICITFVLRYVIGAFSQLPSFHDKSRLRC